MKGSLSWHIDPDEPLTWFSSGMALQWIINEYNRKGRVKGGLLNKASGILAQQSFDDWMLEHNILHDRTDPLLDSEHPVNRGKHWDFRLVDGKTIDVKALPPTAHHANINVNQSEVEGSGMSPCDFYILFRCMGDFTSTELADMEQLDRELCALVPLTSPEKKNAFKANHDKLKAYINRIIDIRFVGWARKAELIRAENLKSGPFGLYYSLAPPYPNTEAAFAENVLHTEL
jgi:hypothetical protein